MIRIDIKPLSVNEAWKGKRYKTAKYMQYQNALLWLLPKVQIPQPPYEIHLKFGFSNSLADWDNPVKPTQDILSKKYGFNDKLIRKAIVDTEIVKKGREYFEFEIVTISKSKYVDKRSFSEL